MPRRKPTIKRHPRICRLCNNPFLVDTNTINRGEGKYCSAQCRAKGRIKKRETVSCGSCGKSFLVYQHLIRVGKGKYCSRACQDKGRSDVPIESRFWARVEKTDGCWIWNGPHGKRGYGNLCCGPIGNRRIEGAHRYSWELHNGPIPNALQVLHHCDNPRCVRPDHLFLGTAQDNVDDKCQKGRCPTGVNNPAAKVNERDVIEIRYLAAAQIPQVAIAEMFGIKQSTVSCIALRKIWKHVP